MISNYYPPDRIDVRFSNGSEGEEMVIPPRIVGELGDALEGIFKALVYGRAEPRIGFLGSRRGSIILTYLLEIAPQITNENIGVVRDAYSFIKEIVTDFFLAGIALGVFKARSKTIGDDEARAKRYLIEEHPHVSELVAGYRKLVRTVTTTTTTTVEEVEITVPQIGQVIVEGARARDIKLIGSEGEVLVTERTPFAGALSNVVGPFTIKPKTDHGKEKIYSGDIEWEGRQVPIVITEWRSDEPIEKSMSVHPVSVKGDLYPIKLAGWESQDVIDPALYRAVAMLQVRTMNIDR